MKNNVKKFNILFLLSLIFIFYGCIDDDTKTTTAATGDMYNGGLVWNNWTDTVAGGSGSLPTGATNKDFVRCKACHGWDALGLDGGYVRRSTNDTRPNPTSGGNLSAKTATITTVGHSSGRLFSTEDLTMPNFTAAGGLTAQQILDVVEFLNNGPKVDDVATLDTTPTPVAYTFTSADTAAGATLYSLNCAGCHGTDGKTVTDSELGAYFASDGKYSEGFHKIIYGNGGSSSMTRTATGNLTAAQARDILAYIQANLTGTFQ